MISTYKPCIVLYYVYVHIWHYRRISIPCVCFQNGLSTQSSAANYSIFYAPIFSQPIANMSHRNNSHSSCKWFADFMTSSQARSLCITTAVASGVLLRGHVCWIYDQTNHFNRARLRARRKTSARQSVCIRFVCTYGCASCTRVIRCGAAKLPAKEV